MAKEKNPDSNSSSFHQSENFLERPRLHALLKEAIEYPLVIVCAGSGYGKTHAVHSFIRKYKANTTWVQISDLDNNATRFWENYTSQVALIEPQAAQRLEEIGFPETDEAFAKYNAVRYILAALPGKNIRVFDDFHLLSNPGILRLMERKVNMSPANMTIILISRTMPAINLIGFMLRGKVFTIQEDALCFTEDEIFRYFSQLKLPIMGEDIRNVNDDTRGWALAINLIGRSLAKKQKYERYALEAMKKNIFRVIESEIAQTISASLLRFLLRISLIDHLAAGLVNELTNGSKKLIEEMEELNAYIRYDFNMDAYMIHHLFRDYLRQKQEHELTNEERRETYQAAAIWCDAYGYYTDTLSYYKKSGDYDAITRKIASLNMQIPMDMAQYALEIFNLIPDEEKSRLPLFPSMYIKLKCSLGQLDEAQAFAMQVTNDYEARPETPERNRALMAIYASWGVLRLNICTYTDVYDFDIYFKKMAEYYDRNPFRIIGAYKLTPMTSRASLVGTNRPGAMEEYIGAVSRAIPYLSRTLSGYNEGFEELVQGELLFYRMDFDNAKQQLTQSINKARENDQYVTQNRALVYLMQIDISRGDFESVRSRLKEMEALLSEKDYGVRYTMYDIACGFYNLAMGQPEQIPEWLKSDFAPYMHPSFLENYANRVRARYCYQTRHYSALFAFIENMMKQPAILYDRIELTILQALSLYHLKRRGEAIAALTQAYRLAESNKLISFFIQFEKEMSTLTAAALKEGAVHSGTNQIPREWLENINQISSAFAKRKAKIISDYRLANNQENEITLTDREIAILKDLANGLPRIEIASNHNISFNMVKLAINSICKNLYVTSLPEAIRAAVDRKII